MRDEDPRRQLWLETEGLLQEVGRGLQRAAGWGETVARTVLRKSQKALN